MTQISPSPHPMLGMDVVQTIPLQSLWHTIATIDPFSADYWEPAPNLSHHRRLCVDTPASDQQLRIEVEW